MDIKTFDIVDFKGRRCRVMQAPREDGNIKVSLYGEVGLDEVNLVESVTLPTFEVGDEVTIIPIPGHEQRNYTYGWCGIMSDMAFTSAQYGTTYTVTEVSSSKQGNGFYYRLDDKYVFAPYHLKKVVDYDFV